MQDTSVAKRKLSPPDPKQFFPNGKLHEEAAKACGHSVAGFTQAISKGVLPFKGCRIRVGKWYVYDWDACTSALKKAQGINQ